MLAHQFLRAEREGDCLLQQRCLQKMLPYFFEAGHHHYARYISWHLLEMQHLPQDTKKDLLDGANVCHHSEGASAVSSDHFGEQMYIKQGKQAGGMKDISTNSEQVAVWIESIGICSHLSMAMHDMYSSNEEATSVPPKHKEQVDKRPELDKEDRQKILDELWRHFHPLNDRSESLYNIVTGQVASTDDVNVHDAIQIGQEMKTTFIPNGFHKTIQKKVKSMQLLKRGVNVKQTTVYDLEAVAVF